MASLFRARRSEEERSGGKILRGRRVPPSVSPYLRPPPPPPFVPPPPAQSISPKWFRGLISGAGKLISSVFRSEDSSSSSSSSNYSSDEDAGSGHNEDEEDIPSRELHELHQRGRKSEVIWDRMEGSQAIIPKSESKLAIEQLLMQETFSRYECNKLIKLIQSRVVDFPSAEVCEDGTQELPNRNNGRDVAFPEASPSLNQNRKLPEIIPYSTSNLDAFSPGSSVREVHTPDLCNKDVMEAKNWLKEKKLASSSKYDLECGPCTLNTEMRQYDIEGEVGSPVDVAKSYMESLPLWRYPSLSSIGFKTPPPKGMHLYQDGTSYATTVHSLPSSKVLKRDHIAIGSWDILDETRRVRLKSTDNMLEISKSKQIESSARLLESGSSKFFSASDKKELYVKDYCSDGALRLSDEKAVVVNCPFNTGSVNSANIALEPEEAVNTVQSTSASSIPTTHPLEPTHSEKGNELKSSNPECVILDENQDVEEPSQTKEQVERVFVPHDPLVSAPTLMEHDGEILFINMKTSFNSGDPLSEIKKLPPENIKSAAPSDADDVSNLNDAHTSNVQSSGVEGILQAKKSSQLNVVSSLEETNCIADSRPQEGNTQIQHEVNESSNKITTNGSSAEFSTNSDQKILTKGGTSCTNSCSGEPTASISEGTSEPPYEATISDAPDAKGTNIAAANSQNGTRMKSIERILTEPKLSTSRRGRKAVVKSQRGRKV